MCEVFLTVFLVQAKTTKKTKLSVAQPDNPKKPAQEKIEQIELDNLLNSSQTPTLTVEGKFASVIASCSGLNGWKDIVRAVAVSPKSCIIKSRKSIQPIYFLFQIY